jgi:hypothetical protein
VLDEALRAKATVRHVESWPSELTAIAHSVANDDDDDDDDDNNNKP